MTKSFMKVGNRMLHLCKQLKDASEALKFRHKILANQYNKNVLYKDVNKAKITSNQISQKNFQPCR